AFGLPSGEGMKIVAERLNIWHPYGTVGALPGVSAKVQCVKEFGGDPSESQLVDLSDGIRTFTEEIRDQDQALKGGREWIEQAAIVLFLGFGFHAQNMKLITPTKRSGFKNVYATVHGMSTTDNLAVQAQIALLLNCGESNHDANARIHRYGSNCFGL